MLQRGIIVLSLRKEEQRFYKAKPLGKNKILWDQTMTHGQSLTNVPAFQLLNLAVDLFVAVTSVSKILIEHNQRRLGRTGIR